MYSNGSGAYKSWPTVNVSPSLTGQSVTSSRGAPSVSITGGSALVDGGSFSFTSNDSNAAPATREFLGGLTGPIQSGTTGTHFTRTNWTQLFATLSDWTYDTGNQLHSRRPKSLFFNPAANGEVEEGRGTYFYDNGASGFIEEYYSCYYYITMNNFTTQWKARRWNWEADVVDNRQPQGYTAAHIANPIFLNVFGDPGGNYPSINPGVYYIPDESGTYSYPVNQWFRFETWVKINTTGNLDGTFRLKLTLVPSGTVQFDSTKTGIRWRDYSSTSNPFRYSVIQNYFGNNTSATSCRARMQDLYISSVSSGTGAFRRVELINASTPAAATKSVIQGYTKSGTTVNIGSVNLGYITETSGLYLVEYSASNSVVTTVGPLTA